MKRIVFLTSIACSFINCFAQSKLELKNLTIEFPNSYTTSKIQDIEVYVVSIDSISFQVLIAPKSSLMIKNENQLKSSLNATTNGYVQSLGTDFKREIKDTSFGLTKSKFVHVYEPIQDHKFKEGFSLITIVEDQALFVNTFVYGKLDDVSRKRIDDFFKSLKFEGKQF